MQEFDLYCAPDGLTATVGSVVRLDGIDGFVDQYFEGRAPGEIIRFLLLAGALDALPASTAGVADMTFITARIVAANDLHGDVEVVSVQPFGAWTQSLPPEPRLFSAVPTLAGAPIEAVLRKAATEGEAMWRTNEKHWRSLSAISMLHAVRQPFGVRVAVLRTNGAPGFVIDVAEGAG